MSEFDQLISALSRPEAYPFDVQSVELHQTHISAVFLAGEFAYKVKKPVTFPFLDFSTLDKRLQYCEEEVRLDSRLAPSVYLGVVPKTATGNGMAVEGNGEPVEYAVKMRRLPHEASLLQRLARGGVSPDWMEQIGERLAEFHKCLPRAESLAAYGRFDRVAGLARENLEQARPLLGLTLSQEVSARLGGCLESELTHHRELIQQRANDLFPVEGHGDLHLDHIYWFEAATPQDRIAIVDGVEFNEQYRVSDPVSDVAFLVMDLRFHGRDDLAAAFFKNYFHATGDYEGELLLPFYSSYRAAVRAKVEGLKLGDQSATFADRAKSNRKAKAYWLFALSELNEPEAKPCVALVGGLPGSGKSTLAHALADAAGFDVVRSDVVRKSLAGVDPTQRGEPSLYSKEHTDNTYLECLRQAEDWLFQGRRVIVDATFWEAKWREAFRQAVAEWHVPCLFLHCQADTNLVRDRLRQRTGDASDTDFSVHERVAVKWEPLEDDWGERLIDVQTASLAAALDLCCRKLMQFELL